MGANESSKIEAIIKREKKNKRKEKKRRATRSEEKEEEKEEKEEEDRLLVTCTPSLFGKLRCTLKWLLCYGPPNWA